MLIEDGRTGDTAQVDSNYQLHTYATTVSTLEQSTLDGNS